LFELVIIAASSALGALSVFILHGSKAVTNHINKMKDKAILHPFESTRSELESLKLDKDSLVDKINRAYKAKNEGKIDTYERDKIILNCKEQIRLQNIRIKDLEEVSNYSEILKMRSELIGLLETRIPKIDSKLKELSTKLIINSATNLDSSKPFSTSPNEKVKEKFTGRTPIATNIKNNHRQEGYNYTEENIQKIQHEITKAIAELEEPNFNSINNTTGNYEPSDKKTALERAQKRDALSFLDYFYDKSYFHSINGK
jgi:hypothetical protein